MTNKTFYTHSCLDVIILLSLHISSQAGGFGEPRFGAAASISDILKYKKLKPVISLIVLSAAIISRICWGGIENWFSKFFLTFQTTFRSPKFCCDKSVRKRLDNKLKILSMKSLNIDGPISYFSLECDFQYIGVMIILLQVLLLHLHLFRCPEELCRPFYLFYRLFPSLYRLHLYQPWVL